MGITANIWWDMTRANVKFQVISNFLGCETSGETKLTLQKAKQTKIVPFWQLAQKMVV